MDASRQELPRMDLPRMVRVRQYLPADHIADIGREVAQRLRAAGLQDKVQAGQNVAITAGSRGMGGFVEILKAVVEQVKACDAAPFIVPAMGSHGGATAEGQTRLLAELGVSEERIGCPIRATMETVALGETPNGAASHFDRLAYEADATIVLGRCKTHPILHEGNGSGINKMITIGLGKQPGAQLAHAQGLEESILQVAPISVAKGNIILGMNVVENGYRQPHTIEVAQPGEFAESDQRCLDVARAYVARVPFQHLDLLVVSQIGKNISGAGMDPNVTGFYRAKGLGTPILRYTRVVALDLTEETQGNALGIGQADITTKRLVEKINYWDTWINMITAASTAGRLSEAAVPIALDTDREAIEVALRSAVPEDAPRVCWIKNTAALDEFWVSEGLLPEVEQNPQLRALSEPEPWPFAEDGAALWEGSAGEMAEGSAWRAV